MDENLCLHILNSQIHSEIPTVVVFSIVAQMVLIQTARRKIWLQGMHCWTLLSLHWLAVPLDVKCSGLLYLRRHPETIDPFDHSQNMSSLSLLYQESDEELDPGLLSNITAAPQHPLPSSTLSTNVATTTNADVIGGVQRDTYLSPNDIMTRDFILDRARRRPCLLVLGELRLRRTRKIIQVYIYIALCL